MTDPDPNPKVHALELLLQVFSPEQLIEIAEASRIIRAENEEGQLADVIIRFKGNHPRWVGRGPIFDELPKPKEG